MVKFNKKLLLAMWSCHNKNYGICNIWDVPLRQIFSQVITFDPQETSNYLGKDAMNSMFLEIIEREKPDIVLLQLIYDEFYFNTITKIRDISPKTKIVNFSGDDDTLFYDYNMMFFPFINY